MIAKLGVQIHGLPNKYKKPIIGLVVLLLGLSLLAFLPAIYDNGPPWTQPRLWRVAQLSSYVGPILVVWGAAVTVTGSFKPLTTLRALPIPVLAWATNVYLDRINPNPWLIDTVGPGEPRSPSFQDSLAWGVTGQRGILLAALSWVLVGVVLARYGPKWAAATAAVPVTISLVAEGHFQPRVLVAEAVVLGLIPFAFGYLAAADRDDDATPLHHRLVAAVGPDRVDDGTG